MSYCIWPSDQHDVAQFGEKGRRLAELRRAGFRVPEWFVVPPEVFFASIGEIDYKRLRLAERSGEAVEVDVTVSLNPEILRELDEALEKLCPKGERVAVRPSPPAKPCQGLERRVTVPSLLFVTRGHVAQAIKAVWRSALGQESGSAAEGAAEGGIPKPPAVIIQRMLDPEIAGRAWGADPETGDRGMTVVDSVLGLSTILSTQPDQADSFRVDREGTVVAREIARKATMHRCDHEGGEGVQVYSTPADDVGESSLSDEQLDCVVRLTRRAGSYFERPQAVEWAFEGGRLYLLQSWQIAGIAEMADPTGDSVLWMRGTPAGGYGSVTTPLTFSFARLLQEARCRWLCRVAHVPQRVVDSSSGVLANTLGFIRGRVCCHLLNWCRILVWMPGFKLNRRLVERVAGFEGPIASKALDRIEAECSRGRFQDALQLLTVGGRLAVNHLLLPLRIRIISARLKRLLEPDRPGIDVLRPEELVARYRTLENTLHGSLGVSVQNGVHAALFAALLGKLSEAWGGDRSGGLYCALLSGGADTKSSQLASQIEGLAGIAAGNHAFLKALQEGEIEEARAEIARDPAFKKQYLAVLRRHGDRCLEELNLESRPIRDEPLVLLRAVGGMASRKLAGQERQSEQGQEDGGVSPQRGRKLYASARREVREQVGKRIGRWMALSWVVKNARARIFARENLHSDFVGVVGRMRRVMLELGKRLVASEVLETAADIAFLKDEEVIGFVEGTEVTVDLKALAGIRAEQFESYRKLEPPARSFETTGIVLRGHDYAELSTSPPDESDERKGVGCCPGIVRGNVRMVTDLDRLTFGAGEILVAEEADAGWVGFVPDAAGIILEAGARFSHGVALARGLGIPSVAW